MTDIKPTENFANAPTMATEKVSPSKQLTNKKTKGRMAGSKKSVNIMGMLQNAAAVKKSQKPTLSIPPGVDAEVFAQLPAEIQQEILKEKGIKPESSSTNGSNNATQNNFSVLNESDFLPSTSKAAAVKRQRKIQENSQNENAIDKPAMQVDEEFLKALPLELRTEIEEDLKAQQQQQHNKNKDESYRPITPPHTHSKKNTTVVEYAISEHNIFAQKNCIDLLLEWVKSSSVPENYDVELMCEHARELIRANDIEKLYDPLSFLCR